LSKASHNWDVQRSGRQSRVVEEAVSGRCKE
jgi:hypothetical protein